MCLPYSLLGFVSVDFVVEALGSNAAALDNSTQSFVVEIERDILNLTIDGGSLTFPKQDVSIIDVDVTPAVNITYPFVFKVQ